MHDAKTGRMLRAAIIAIAPCAIPGSAVPLDGGEPAPLDRLDGYDVVYDSPGPDCTGSMPLGNGDIGLNVWVEPEGDILLLISKTDAWDESGRLVKVGRVRLRLDPPTLVDPAGMKVRFRQRLILRDGAIKIFAGHDDAPPGEMLPFPESLVARIRVDALRPAIEVWIEKQSGPAVLQASLEIWRQKERPFADRDGSHSESGARYAISSPAAWS